MQLDFKKWQLWIWLRWLHYQKFNQKEDERCKSQVAFEGNWLTAVEMIFCFTLADISTQTNGFSIFLKVITCQYKLSWIQFTTSLINSSRRNLHRLIVTDSCNSWKRNRYNHWVVDWWRHRSGYQGAEERMTIFNVNSFKKIEEGSELSINVVIAGNKWHFTIIITCKTLGESLAKQTVNWCCKREYRNLNHHHRDNKLTTVTYKHGF